MACNDVNAQLATRYRGKKGKSIKKATCRKDTKTTRVKEIFNRLVVTSKTNVYYVIFLRVRCVVIGVAIVNIMVGIEYSALHSSEARTIM